MRTRFLLVHNPTAGLHGRARVERLVAAVDAMGGHVELAVTRAPGDVETVLAGRTDLDAVLAAGGDGTIRAVATALGRRPLPIGIVPIGTGNVMAAEIGLPASPETLARVLMSDPAIEIEGARANGQPFFLMAGAGFDGEVVKRLAAPLKQRVGKIAYIPATLQALRLPAADLDVTVDGASYRAGWVVVARARSYGGAFVMAPEAGLTRPGLVAVLFHSTRLLVRIRQLLALAIGRHHRLGDVDLIPCRQVSIRSASPVAVEVDGDMFGATPLDVDFGGPRMRLIVPSAYAEKVAAAI